MPMVSVVVATYRRDAVLHRALESLAFQTYKDFEIILVDDNGIIEWNEKVKRIYDEFQKKYPQICIKLVVNNPNLGSAKTRNVGIEEACGQYVTFLDDDDVYLPEKIEKQLNHLLSVNADYGITDCYLYNEDEKVVDKRIRSYIQSDDKNALMQYHLMHHMTGTDTMMFKKAYLQKIGSFDSIDVGDEFYLMQKAILGEGIFCYFPECHVKAYVHTGEGGLSSGEGKINGENELYEYKTTFFNDLDKKSIRFIKVRHYAVLAYAYLRMHQLRGVINNLARGFLVSPLLLCKILFFR